MLCSLGPEHPSAHSLYPKPGSPVVLGDAEPRGDPTPCPALPTWLCSILPCPVRGTAPLPSWAVARLCHDTPCPWHQGPSALLPASPPTWIWGAQRDAEIQGVPREAPMGPCPWPRRWPCHPWPGHCHTQTTSRGSRAHSLLPPLLPAPSSPAPSPVPSFPPLIHNGASSDSCSASSAPGLMLVTALLGLSSVISWITTSFVV